uniref:Uncharacterized protein n=2 Tax=Parascaris univalens TaxID=6257 RepID=A0A915BUD0_PARUN
MMEHYWRMKLLVILICFPWLTYAIDEETMRAIRILKTKQHRVRYVSAPSINVRIPDLSLSTMRSGSHLINRTAQFSRGQGSSSLKRISLNALPTEVLGRNHSMKKDTENGNLSHINRMAPQQVHIRDVVPLHESIPLTQLNIENSMDEQVEKLKDLRIANTDQYLNANSIREEADVRRLIERTTMIINVYPSVKTTSSAPSVTKTEFTTTSNATSPSSESTPLPQIPDPERSNGVPPVLPPPSQVHPSIVSLNIGASELANPSMNAPHLTLPHHSTPDLENPVPLKGSSFNSSAPVHADVQYVHRSIKKIPSISPVNPLNSTTHISAPQLSLTRFTMYPSQVPANKIIPLPNAAPLPSTAGVAPQFTNKVQSINSTATPAPNDDTLGCTWDFITNSCKDVFALNWCARCHDFGNVFLHNCKCIVK